MESNFNKRGVLGSQNEVGEGVLGSLSASFCQSSSFFPVRCEIPKCSQIRTLNNVRSYHSRLHCSHHIDVYKQVLKVKWVK